MVSSYDCCCWRNLFFRRTVPILAGWLIHIVAEQSVWFLHIFDLETTLDPIDYGEGSKYYRPGSEHQKLELELKLIVEGPTFSFSKYRSCLYCASEYDYFCWRSNLY